VGEGGDEVSVARFIADQRTLHRVPHAFTCRLLGLSESWFYKWLDRPPTNRQRRQAEVDAEVARHFTDSDRTYGSPRIFTDLIEAGWKISEKTVAESMARQGLFGRKPKRRKGLTRQDKTAPKFPDLVKRDFTATKPNLKWCGDITEIPTDEGKLYLATVIDLFSRRLLACPTSLHPDTELCADAIKIAVAARGGRQNIEGVIFHTDRGSTYTSKDFTKLCKKRLGVRQSMGRVGSCFDNAAAEAFFSTDLHTVSRTPILRR
jgi:transposase InsO family protein